MSAEMELRSDLTFGEFTLDRADERLLGPAGPIRLGNKAFQVLLLLVQQEGRLLTKDSLFSSVWDGTIVSESALTSVIKELRRALGDDPQEPRYIASVYGRGYRFIAPVERVEGRERLPPAARLPATTAGPRPEIESQADRAHPAASSNDASAATDRARELDTDKRAGRPPAVSGMPAARPRRRFFVSAIAATIAVLLVLGGTLLWGSRSAEPAPATVAVLAEGAGAEDRGLARDLAADLSRLAAARPTQLVVLDAGQTGQADYVARVGSERRAGRLHARLTLSSRPADELLWSARFDRLVEERTELRQQAAVKLGDVLLCATEATMAEGHRMDAVTRRLYFAACDRSHDPLNPRMLALLRQITERSPDFARGWAMRAVYEAYAGSLSFGAGPEDTPQKRAFREAAARQLARARALDPTLGEISFAEALLLTRPGQWAEQLAIYDRGIATAPDFSPLHNYRAFALSEVGRTRETIESARRAVALDPLAPENYRALVDALANGGRLADARQALAEAEQLWPGFPNIRSTRFRLEVGQGDPRQALLMLDDPANSDILDFVRSASDLRLFLHARIERTPAAIDAAVIAYAALLHRQPDSIFSYLQALGEFGRVDEAYRAMERPGAIDPLRWGSGILFRPQMRPIRNDPRFMPLALRLGLLHYWRASGHWPDFCAEPDLPYDCRAEARRLLAVSR